MVTGIDIVRSQIEIARGCLLGDPELRIHSQEDIERREELTGVLNRAVKFSGQAQTKSGGWGYISAADGNNFDEGSTTITQVQGLRGCRNAGIPVPKEIIDNQAKWEFAEITGKQGSLF